MLRIERTETVCWSEVTSLQAPERDDDPVELETNIFSLFLQFQFPCSVIKL